MLKVLAKLNTAVLARRDRGATMVEYGLMVALIAVVVLVAVGPLGRAISTLFDNVTGSL
jgi:pilus assembly protein Flp/PilA